MKKLKTIFFTFLLAFIYSNTNAQQAQAADFIGSWTGTDNNGIAYTLIMNQDQGAVLKINNVNTDVKWWKLSFNEQGDVIYNGSQTTLRLITNTPISGTSGQTSLGNAASGFKTHYTEVTLDLNSNSMEMKADFVGGSSQATGFGKQAVVVTLTK